MTREQLEANWEWDPKRGSIPFPRPRLTPRNIRDQRRLARPNTLVHWAGRPCARAKKMIDTTEVLGNYPGPRRYHMTAASHIGNVNCLQCRKNHLACYGTNTE